MLSPLPPSLPLSSSPSLPLSLSLSLLTQMPLPPNMPGRIWHTMSSHHPSSPANAEVVIFGGTSQNLFASREHDLANISQTTIMHYGQFEERVHSWRIFVVTSIILLCQTNDAMHRLIPRPFSQLANVTLC
jgi:hypothetical protein